MGKVTNMDVDAAAMRADRSRGEQTALRHLAERMATQFPDVRADDIAKAIQGSYQQFESSRIRDFIPVLVERSVREDLAKLVRA
jgi:hypothetical protein